MNCQSELLTTEEVAKRLKVQDNTIRRWRRQGVITAAAAVGRTHRYLLADVLKSLGHPATGSAVPAQ